MERKDRAKELGAITSTCLPLTDSLKGSEHTLHKKWICPLRISSIIVTKSPDLVTFTEKILNGKLHFLCSDIVIADSWFGLVMSAMQLMNHNDLYSIMLQNIAHNLHPRHHLWKTELSRGKWIPASTEIEDVQSKKVKFLDLQEKQFIGTCSADIPGPARHIKLCLKISRPKIIYSILNQHLELLIFITTLIKNWY